MITIALASDHAGYTHKEKVKEYLTQKGFSIKDFGTTSTVSVDYPHFIRPAAEAVAQGCCDKGIIFGGSGNGEAMVANKVCGIRCAVCWSIDSARFAKEHNDANIISIGERLVPLELTLTIIDTWLSKEFEGGRHQKRIEQIEKI